MIATYTAVIIFLLIYLFVLKMVVRSYMSEVTALLKECKDELNVFQNAFGKYQSSDQLITKLDDFLKEQK